MVAVDSPGSNQIDRCGTCGAIWFDPGEIRELTEGRLSPEPGATTQDVPVPSVDSTGRSTDTPMARMHRLAASMRCPRCDAPLSALDYQATGVPVIICSACRGFLVTRASSESLSERFAFSRLHADRYAAMGESMAAEMRNSLGLKYMTDGKMKITANPSFSLPIVLPLSTEAPGPRSFPAATWTFLAVPLILMLLSSYGGVSCRLPWPPGGLPSGTGLSGAPFLSLLAYPFLPGGLLPLVTGVLFLFVLGRQVEERTGLIPFAGLYLLGAITAGVVHMVVGRIGAPIALGSSGAVAAVLGAYLVFFPDVPIKMYGMGRIVSAPAYLFACCWAVAILMANPESGGMTGFLLRIADPTPLSLWGNLGGFASGMLYGVAARSKEEGFW